MASNCGVMNRVGLLLLLFASAIVHAIPPDHTALYVQVIRGTDQDRPPGAGYREIGPKLSAFTAPPCSVRAAIGPSAACDPFCQVITPPILQVVVKVLDIAEVMVGFITSGCGIGSPAAGPAESSGWPTASTTASWTRRCGG